MGEFRAWRRRSLDVTPATVKKWQRRRIITSRRVDARREHFYHPGQNRSPLRYQTQAARRRKTDGLLSARQLADLHPTSPQYATALVDLHRLDEADAVNLPQNRGGMRYEE